MAGEVRIQTSLEVDNGNFVLPRLGNTSFKANQGVAGGGLPGEVLAGTGATGTLVNTTALTSEGWCFLKNLDSANFVTWGPLVAATFHPVGKLKPGESCVFRLDPAKVFHVKGDTAACRTQAVVIED